MPLSRAKQAVAAEHNCTQAVAAAALALLHDGEWHHVGKYAARCDYFDTADSRLAGAIAHITSCGGAAKWVARREQLRSARRATMHWIKFDFVRLRHETQVRLAYMRRRAKARAGDAEAIRLIGFFEHDLSIARREDKNA